MSTTGQQIVDRATARNTLNGAVVATIGDPEKLAWIAAEQRLLYVIAARFNPEYFGKTSTTVVRAAYMDNWDIAATPGDVAAITAVRAAALVGTVTGIAVGTEINLITSRYPDWDAAPRVYLRGRKLYGYGTELGAASINMVSQLTLDYAELPTGPTSLNTALRLPDEWCALPELRLAMLFAARDNRPTELQTLIAEYEVQFATFREHVFVLDHSAARPLQAIPALPLAPPAPQQ